eukprot:sb/3467564/
MGELPSPDKRSMEQVLLERQRMFSPLNPAESKRTIPPGLLVDSPTAHDKSIGHTNASFSRTKVAASVPGSERLVLEDAKKTLSFEQGSEVEEEAALMNKQNRLLQQLFSQQEELKRLEEKQRQLVDMKRVAENKLAAANRTVETVQCSAETPRKMLSKYASLSANEIPYQIEQILTGRDAFQYFPQVAISFPTTPPGRRQDIEDRIEEIHPEEEERVDGDERQRLEQLQMRLSALDKKQIALELLIRANNQESEALIQEGKLPIKPADNHERVLTVLFYHVPLYLQLSRSAL